jgi:hypothetical protein
VTAASIPARRQRQATGRSRWPLWAVGLLLAGAAAGCSTDPHRQAASSVAVSFVASLERGDGSAACELLTSEAQDSATGATDESCAQAIGSVKEQGLTVEKAEVWGDAAQVRIGTDVVFLRRISASWRVSAAGCVRQSEGPYDCKVGG